MVRFITLFSIFLHFGVHAESVRISKFFEKIVFQEHPEIPKQLELEKRIHARKPDLAKEAYETIFYLNVAEGRRLMDSFVAVEKHFGRVPRVKEFRKELTDGETFSEYMAEYFSSDPKNFVREVLANAKDRRVQPILEKMDQIYDARKKMSERAKKKPSASELMSKAADERRILCVKITEISAKERGSRTEKGWGPDAYLAADISFEYEGQRASFYLSNSTYEESPVSGATVRISPETYADRLEVLQEARRTGARVCVPYMLNTMLNVARVVDKPMLE